MPNHPIEAVLLEGPQAKSPRRAEGPLEVVGREVRQLLPKVLRLQEQQNPVEVEAVNVHPDLVPLPSLLFRRPPPHRLPQGGSGDQGTTT